MRPWGSVHVSDRIEIERVPGRRGLGLWMGDINVQTAEEDRTSNPRAGGFVPTDVSLGASIQDQRQRVAIVGERQAACAAAVVDIVRTGCAVRAAAAEGDDARITAGPVPGFQS